MISVLIILLCAVTASGISVISSNSINASAQLNTDTYDLCNDNLNLFNSHCSSQYNNIIDTICGSTTGTKGVNDYVVYGIYSYTTFDNNTACINLPNYGDIFDNLQRSTLVNVKRNIRTCFNVNIQTHENVTRYYSVIQAINNKSKRLYQPFTYTFSILDGTNSTDPITAHTVRQAELIMYAKYFLLNICITCKNCDKVRIWSYYD